MAYERLEAYNPALWGIPQETFDAERLVTNTLANIGNNSLQAYGLPIDKYPFIARELKDSAKDNPLSRQYFCFGLATIGQAFEIKDMFSDIHKKTTHSSLIGWCTGADNMGYDMDMGNYLQATGGTQGNGDGNNFNGGFNNTNRWYTNKSGQLDQYSCYAQNHLILKVFREDVCVGVDLMVCPPISDGDIIPVKDDNAFKNPTRMTLEEWLEGDNQKKYPNIVSIIVDVYYGQNDSRSRVSWGPYTDVDTYVDDIWEKVTHTSIPGFVGFDFEEPRYGKLSPSGIQSRSYLPQRTIFTGINAYMLNTYEICYWRCCRGVDRHKIIKYAIQGLSESDRDARVISFFDGSVEDIKNILGSLGFPVTLKNSKLANGKIGEDPDIFVPIIDPKTGAVTGLTNDPEKKKKELEKNPNGANTDPDDWSTDYDGPDPEDPEDPNYDPVEDPEDEKEEEEIEMGKPKLGTVGVFNRCYAVNSDELKGLSNYLWNVDEETFDTILKGLKLIGVNPIDAIISVIMFPFEIATGTASKIRIGVVDTDITGVPINFNATQVFDLGTCYFYRKYKNYLDYEPYTTASLYIPYVGVIPISVAEFTKKYINVKMAVDLLTGSGQVVVYAGGIPVIYRNCKIGCQIAVTGQDSSRIASNYINAVTELASGVAGVAGGIASGNAMGAIGSAANLAKGGLDFYTAGNVPIESRGCDSPQCGFFMPQRCYLIVNRPRVYEIDESIYAKSVGIACYETGSIGSFHGFSKFENVKLDISVATEEEKEQIKSLLASGVYLP